MKILRTASLGSNFTGSYKKRMYSWLGRIPNPENPLEGVTKKIPKWVIQAPFNTLSSCKF